MTNLTLALDDALLKDARTVAFERETTLTEMIRGYLKDLVHGWSLGRQAEARRLLDVIDRNSRDIGGVTWNREDLHERR